MNEQALNTLLRAILSELEIHSQAVSLTELSQNMNISVPEWMYQEMLEQLSSMKMVQKDLNDTYKISPKGRQLLKDLSISA